MVRPTSRVLALLELLQAGGQRTVAELAEQLGVDGRTVRRYVRHLRELDIPVEAVRGRYGGYRLARHHRMPPLMLTDEEAVAIVWALLAGVHADSVPATPMAVRSASAKVRRVLPAPLTRRIDAVLDVVSFTDRSAGRRDHDQGAQVLLALTQAARDRHPVAFGYTAPQDRPAQRCVQPHGVVAHRGRLYLTGFDVERQAVRTFRLDRVTDVRPLDGTFGVPAGTDPVRQVVGPLAASPQRHDVSVRIRADVAHVRSQMPEMLASVTPVPAADDGWLRVFLRAERLEWVAGRLAALDRPFVVEHPPALQDAVTALGDRLLAAARARTDGAAASIWTEDDGAEVAAPGRG